MGIVSSLLALVLVGAGDSPVPHPAQTPDGVTFQVSVVEMGSIGWRSGMLHRLKMVGQDGGAVIWTTDRDTARALRKRAQSNVAPPMQLTSTGSGGAAVVNFEPRDHVFVASQTRMANGPRHHASAVAYQPEARTIKENWHLAIKGRPVSGMNGVATEFSCDGTWVTAVHSVKVPEVVVDEFGVEETIIQCEVQVPEVANCQVRGDWIIPSEGVLVVSLGARSVVDLDRLEQVEHQSELTDVVCVSERLVIVEPNPTAPAALAPAAWRVVPPERVLDVRMGPGGPYVFDVNVPGPIASPKPVLPSASLPMAGPSLVPEPLPPLPDEQVKPASLIPPPAPLATPQALHVQGRLMFDPTARRASDLADQEPDCCAGETASATLPGMTAVRTIRIPLGGNLGVEIRASVAPAPKP